MKIIMLGNRGSRPIGASEHSPFQKYGGDTTTIGIIGDDNTLISLDSGTGFWKWPYTLKNLLGKEPPYDMNVFYSHYHDDHTAGITQAPILFDERNKLSLHGPAYGIGIRKVFNDHASQPANPDLLAVYQAEIAFHSITGDTGTHQLSNKISISWITVPHGAEEALAYRVEENGRNLVVVSDTHHDFDLETDEPLLNNDLVEFMKDADILVYDCHFTDQELKDMPFLRGFGHSTGEHGVRLAQAANIRTLVTHHHDPNKVDAVMDKNTKLLKAYAQDKSVQIIAAQPSLLLNTQLSPQELLASVKAQNNPKKRYKAIKNNIYLS